MLVLFLDQMECVYLETMLAFYHRHIRNEYDRFPGRKIRAGSGRKAPEVTGTWKQYSNRKIFGFFPMISDRFLLESTGN